MPTKEKRWIRSSVLSVANGMIRGLLPVEFSASYHSAHLFSLPHFAVLYHHHLASLNAPAAWCTRSNAVFHHPGIKDSNQEKNMGEGGYKAVDWVKALQAVCDCRWGCTPCGPGDLVKNICLPISMSRLRCLRKQWYQHFGPFHFWYCFSPLPGGALSSICSLSVCHSNM